MVTRPSLSCARSEQRLFAVGARMDGAQECCLVAEEVWTGVESHDRATWPGQSNIPHTAVLILDVAWDGVYERRERRQRWQKLGRLGRRHGNSLALACGATGVQAGRHSAPLLAALGHGGVETPLCLVLF